MLPALSSERTDETKTDGTPVPQLQRSAAGFQATRARAVRKLEGMESAHSQLHRAQKRWQRKARTVSLTRVRRQWRTAYAARLAARPSPYGATAATYSNPVWRRVQAPE